tara:strand:+ start:29662 stop:30117 length:456 start_codon:yes stop_codon:yes gene_type:complete
MKNIIVFVGLLSFSLSSLAGSKLHGVGAMLGEPTGITYRYQFKDNVFLDGGLDYRLGDRAHIYGSYLMIAPQSLLIFGQVTKWFYGGGFRSKTKEHDDKDKTFFGARGATGLLYTPKSEPFELFIQLAPTLNIIPETSVDFDFNIGARFVF